MLTLRISISKIKCYWSYRSCTVPRHEKTLILFRLLSPWTPVMSECGSMSTGLYKSPLSLVDSMRSTELHIRARFYAKISVCCRLVKSSTRKPKIGRNIRNELWILSCEWKITKSSPKSSKNMNALTRLEWTFLFYCYY